MDSVSTVYGDVDISSLGGSDQTQAPQTTSEGQASPEASGGQAPAQAQEQQKNWWESYEDSEMEFVADGKNLKAPLSKVRQWAQQGYNYSQKMAALKDEQSQWTARLDDIKKDTEIAEITQFARQNPEWDQFVRNLYQERQNFSNEEWRRQASDPYLSKIQSLEKTISELAPEVKAFREERQKIVDEAADKKLDAEIDLVAKRYSKIGMDLKAIDKSSGLSLEETALQFGTDNGIPFRSAFLELYGDKIDALREEAIKKQVANDFAKKQKEGFIGVSPTPNSAQRSLQRPRTWGDATEQAIADLKSGKYG
jgi:hypothetical protein